MTSATVPTTEADAFPAAARRTLSQNSATVRCCCSGRSTAYCRWPGC
jgi:hypothetical protein